jgi:prolyl-tRNA editing enzyme YbaK/EbsC (Cys-tRNA(Pro) deacylase)
MPIYLDVSLKAFDVVYPAGGSRNTSVEIPVERLFDLVAERWVDLCRLPEEPSGA